MTDIEREAMELWEWVAFLDRTNFFWELKTLVKLGFSISALQLGANAKKLDLLLNI